MEVDSASVDLPRILPHQVLQPDSQGSFHLMSGGTHSSWIKERKNCKAEVARLSAYSF